MGGGVDHLRERDSLPLRKVKKMKGPDVANILEEISILERRLLPKDEGDPSFRKRYPYSGFEF
jgi:hypothetical protein